MNDSRDAVDRATDDQPGVVAPGPIDASPTDWTGGGLADDGDAGFGRVGYGRFGRFTPLLLGLLIVAVLLAIWLVQHQTANPLDAGNESGLVQQEEGALQGRLAPDVTLTLLDGAKLPLKSLRGDVVVLNFWASWCGPCQQEAPALEAFSQSVAADGEATRVVGVGIRTDNDADARAFVKAHDLTYAIGRDTDTDQPGVGPIEAAFGIPSAYPATIFIRPDGVVDRLHLGPISEAQLRYGVDEARQATARS